MKFIIGIDYDETLFQKSYPELGNPRKDVIEKVKEFKKAGAEIILWTCREGKSLQEAISRCLNEGLEFDGVNESSKTQKEYNEKHLLKNGEMFGLRKIFAHLYVDDRSPGSIEYFLGLNAKKTCKEISEKT